jgi:hypothetical protein
LITSFVVWLISRRGINGCLSSYEDNVGDIGGANVEENKTKLG